MVWVEKYGFLQKISEQEINILLATSENVFQ